MNATIENYRGIEIWFDTDNESFQCDIDDERSVKKSYVALKKFIDEYLKENHTFKVIHVEANPAEGRWTKDDIVKIVGVRKDGRFIGEDKDGNKKQISDYDLSKYMIKNIHNIEPINALKELTAERERLRVSHNEQEKEIISRMVIVTLKDYKKSLNQK